MATFTQATDLYQAVLRELDKFKAPSFTFYDFTYFFNKGLQQYINLRYQLFDTKEQTIDDLRSLIAPPSSITIGSSKQGTLPADYQHCIGMKANMRLLTAYQCNPIGYTWQEPMYRMTADLIGFAMIDYYTRPKEEYVYYKINQNIVQVIFDTVNYPVSYAICDTVLMEYIKVPTQIILAGNPGNITTNTQLNATNLQFVSDYVWNEVVNRVAELFFENIESRRMQSHPPENKTIV